MMISNMPSAESPFTMPAASRQRNNPFAASSPASADGASSPSPAFSLGGNLGKKSSLGTELISVMEHPTSGDLWGSGTQSRSQQATMASFWASERVGMAKNSGMLNMLESFGGISVSGTYYGGSELTGSEVKEKIGDIKEDEIWDSSEEMLDEAINDIERRAEAAMNPVDENGNPLPAEDLVNGDVASAGSPTGSSGTQEAARTTRSAGVAAQGSEKAHNSTKAASTPVAESARAVRVYSANQQARPSTPEAPAVDVQA